MNFPRLFPVRPRLSRPRLRPALVLRAGLSRPAVAATLPILGALPLLATPVSAKPAKKMSGVSAWTNASQTYLRVRPSQDTPIVAKVPRHTELFVWGKTNGWYRVETQDHMFGWVHYELLNSAALGRVKELSPAAIARASERNGSQTLWGDPAQLTAYFKKYGAPGAVAGLHEMGIDVSFGAKAQTKKVVAKTPVKPAPKAAVKVAAKPSAPRVNRAAAPRVVTPNAVAQSGVKAPVVRAFAGPVEAPARPAAAPVKLLPAPPPRVSVPAPKAAPAKKVSSRQSARDKKREQLRAKLGTTDTATPPLPIGDIAPVSPEELMKARRAYLDARKKKFEGAPAKDNAPATENNTDNDQDAMGGPQAAPSAFEFGRGSELDADGWAPFNFGGWNARTSGPTFADWDADRAPGFRLVTEEEEQEGDSEMDNGLDAWMKLPTLRLSQVEVKDNAKQKPKAAAKAPAKTEAKTAPSRGGSPRDRYKTPDGDFRQNMANQALSYRGRPYIRGAASPSRGFDCSGLVYFLLRQRGYNPPRTAAGFATYGTAVARGQWKPGDLLLFANTYKRGISHIGIYLGNNNFVHAASTRQGVRVDSMNTKYYAAKYHSARRVPAK